MAGGGGVVSVCMPNQPVPASATFWSRVWSASFWSGSGGEVKVCVRVCVCVKM